MRYANAAVAKWLAPHFWRKGSEIPQKTRWSQSQYCSRGWRERLWRIAQRSFSLPQRSRCRTDLPMWAVGRIPTADSPPKPAATHILSVPRLCGSAPGQTSVYKGYKQDKIEMRGDRAEMSDFPLYLNTVAGGLDRRDQTIGGFSFVVKIYAVPVVEIIG